MNHMRFAMLFVFTALLGAQEVLQQGGTVQQEIGTAIKLQNNGPNVRLANNIVVINGGLGIDAIGDLTGAVQRRLTNDCNREWLIGW